MKYASFGDNSKVLKDGTFETPKNNSAEFLETNDILSARTLNRPIRNLQEDNEEQYTLIQTLLKSVYGNFSGIVPNVFEDFSNFSYHTIGTQTYLRVPTGLLFGRGSWEEDHSYYIKGEENYQDDLISSLLQEDGSCSLFVKPNTSLFERNLAELISLDLNDEDNDIKLNYILVNKEIRYTLDITYNNKSFSLPAKQRSIVDGSEVFTDTEIEYRTNSFDIFNDFVTSFSDLITISESNLIYFNSLEVFVPISSDYETSTYQLRYKFGEALNDNTAANINRDFSGHFYICNSSSSLATDLDTIKIADIKNGVVTLALETLDQRLIATKRAELDTLLVKLRSNLNGDIFADNFSSTSEGVNISSSVNAEGENLSVNYTNISSISEKQTVDTKELNVSNADINLNDVSSININKDEENLASVDLNEDEIKSTYKGKELISISEDEIEVGNNIVPTEDKKFNLGSPTKRWSNIYADIQGSTKLAKILYNEGDHFTNEGRNLIISNLTLEETRLLKHDVGKKILSDASRIYHFDYNISDNLNENDLTIIGSYNYVNEDDEGNTSPVVPYEPFDAKGKFLLSSEALNIATPNLSTSGTYSLDVWFKYTYNTNLLTVTEDNLSYSINNLQSEIPFYTDGILSIEDSTTTYIDESGESVTSATNSTVLFYKNAEYDYSYTTEDGTYETQNSYYENDASDKFEISGFGYYDSLGDYVATYFMKISESESNIVLVFDNTEYTLYQNNAVMKFAFGDWIHLGISSGESDFKVFINDLECSISANLQENVIRSLTPTTFSVSVNTTGIDELFYDPNVAYTLEDYANVQNEDGYNINWGTLDYTEDNFILDLADTTKVFSNLFSSNAFINAVTNIHNSL